MSPLHCCLLWISVPAATQATATTRFIGSKATRTARSLPSQSPLDLSRLSSNRRIHTTHTRIETAMSLSTSSSCGIAAVAQLCATHDKRRNLVHVAHCAHMACQANATMLFLPECFGYMGESSRDTFHHAEASISSNNSVMGLDGKKPGADNDTHKNDPELTRLLESVVKHGLTTTGDKSDDDDNAPTTLSRKSSISLLHGLQVIAQSSGLWISGGGMHERVRDTLSIENEDEHEDSNDNGNNHDKKVYNTHVILNDQGDIVSLYRKVHLFDVPSLNLMESASTNPGTSYTTCSSPLGTLGLSTCYDLRFPEVYTTLVQDGEAQLLLVPSAFTVPTGRAHWHVLLQARAIETQCYILAAAQGGLHNAKRRSFGHALIVDPWGQIVAEVTDHDETTSTIITWEIDLDYLSSIRERMPIQRHREAAANVALEPVQYPMEGTLQ